MENKNKRKYIEEDNYDNSKILKLGKETIIYDRNMIIYFFNDKKYRENGPAFIYKNYFLIGENQEEWWFNGKLHRDEPSDSLALAGEDGPAIIGKNYEEWWFNGKRHRENGPAIIYYDIKIFYRSGERVTGSYNGIKQDIINISKKLNNINLN